MTAAVVRGAGDIDRQDDRELAFLAELADERGAHAGGDIPVDEADLVAVLVFAEVIEIEPLAAERGMVFAGERLAHEPPAP